MLAPSDMPFALLALRLFFLVSGSDYAIVGVAYITCLIRDGVKIGKILSGNENNISANFELFLISHIPAVPCNFISHLCA